MQDDTGLEEVMAVRESVQVPKLVGLVLGCEAAGIVGSLATRDAINTWYPTLKKPAFNPPNWIFGPVWTLLYAMMGVALHVVTQRGEPAPGVMRAAKVLFGIQLALNTLWSILFFGRRSPFAALVEIAFLWLAILATTLAFAKVSRAASLLMLPYLAWVSFAALLNFSIWRLNR